MVAAAAAMKEEKEKKQQESADTEALHAKQTKERAQHEVVCTNLVVGIDNNVYHVVSVFFV